MFNLELFTQNHRAPDGSVTVMNGDSMQGGFDPGLSRPYLDDKGRAFVDVTTGWKPITNSQGQPVRNERGIVLMQRITEPQLVRDRVHAGLPVLNVSNASILRKDQWIRLDAAVQTASRQRLRAWSDLRAAATMGGFDGMATPILEREIINDAGMAQVDMEGISEGRNWVPKYGLQGIPLPITHSDFWISERFLAASRTKGQPADTTRGEMAGRRVGELIEQTLIGTVTGMTYGDSSPYLYTSKVYGYTNHPDRITKTDLQTSANMATNIATTGGSLFLQDVIEMIELAYAKNFFGPFVLYVSGAYDALLGFDFKANSDKSIRGRVLETEQIQDIRRLDYLAGDVMLLIQLTPDVVEAVNGLEITTVQWDMKGGMQHMFKVMGIQVPLIKSVYQSGVDDQFAGIVHATTS
jgi:hypothetical protein